MKTKKLSSALFPFLSILFISFWHSGKTQNIKVLRVGDTIPPELMRSILTDQNTREYAAEAENKLVVLDFWNVGCTACTADFPRLDSIQKENRETLQIISVTYNTKEEIEKMAKTRAVKFPDFPMITGDTILKRIFPHMGDPLHVWIDKNGAILYKTHHYNLTTPNVVAVLENKKPYFGERARIKFYTNEKTLLEQAADELKPDVKYSSILVAGYNDYSDRYPINSDLEDTVKIKPAISTQYANIITLYKEAFKEELFGEDYEFLYRIYANWIFTDIKDKSVLKKPLDDAKLDDWLKKNIYWYELIIPEEKQKQRFKYMQEDLHRFLGYTAKIVMRKTECYSLEKINALKKIRTKDKTKKTEYFYKDRKFHLVNMPLTKALYFLMLLFDGAVNIPVTNNTGSNECIDLSINADIESVEDLNKEIASFGLVLKKRVLPIKMLSITD